MKKLFSYAKKNFPFILLLIQTVLLTWLLISFKSGFVQIEYNIFFSTVFIAFLLLLPIGYVAAAIIEYIVFALIFYINEFLIIVRMRPINYIDLFCINDAAHVTGSYSLVMNSSIAFRLIAAFLITGVNCFLIIKFYKKPKKIYLAKPLSAAVTGICFIAILAVFSRTDFMTADSLGWDEKEFIEKNGIFYSVFSEYKTSIITEPEGYSKENADVTLNKYKQVKQTGDSPTNIIVIMNESFMDYSLIFDNDFTEDPLEAIHNSDENIKEGKLAVNIYGGSTCNSEFEFLTGCSLAFLNKDDIPYVRYDLSELDTFGNDVEKLGYRSTPIHPYIGVEWRRKVIYPNWFTEPFISGERFSKFITDGKDYDEIFEQDKYVNFGTDLEYLCNYISDAESFRKITEQTKLLNAQNSRSFIFNVTMQNHGGYERSVKGDLKEIKYTDDYSSNIYLTLTKHTAEAYMEYIEQLKESPEPTVVLMFGDHQPAIYDLALETRKSNTSTVNENTNKYIVPYFLWANYDIEWDIPDYLSLNYLSAVLKKNCGLRLTHFDSLRLAAMEEYPVLTYLFSMDKNGSYVETAEARQSNVIKDYEMVQYDKIFGK